MPSSLDVRIEGPEFLPTFGALWSACDSNSFFRAPAHLEMICDIARCELAFVVAYRAGNVRCALPFALKTAASGKVINSLPFFGTYSAVVGEFEAEDVDQIVQGLLQHAYQEHVAAVTLIDDWRAQSFAKIKGHFIETTRSNQFIALSKLRGCDPIASYHQKTRNLVRKAEKLGVIVKLSHDAADVRGLRAAHIDTMAGVGGIPKPDCFFERLFDKSSPLGQHRLYVATLDGHDCAYLLNFYRGDTVEYYMPATYVTYRSAQPLNLLIHRAISDAVTDGFAFWNFGGTWPTQETLRHFKIRWGSEEATYKYFTKVIDERILASDRSRLMREYPYFFVMPFDRLAPINAASGLTA